ncbi:DUF4430 domain-containing protein [Alkalibacterium sp. MB6]|uniref:DUF4430 domain-containing protein n=1 Tax=Alkalibacterium sp. MB6 TaxID=2081965 RepID=UPI00137B5720|nr:DUF4430 domain-containing protein [Alkalibacterium sp. MB6]
MNKKQKYLVGIVATVILIVIGLTLAGLFSNDNDSSSDADKEVQILILTADEEIANEMVGASSNETLMEIMEHNFDVSVSEEGFVESIEGVEQNPDDNEYWVFEVNNEMVTVSAEEFIPKDTDLITWELMAF